MNYQIAARDQTSVQTCIGGKHSAILCLIYQPAKIQQKWLVTHFGTLDTMIHSLLPFAFSLTMFLFTNVPDDMHSIPWFDKRSTCIPQSALRHIRTFYTHIRYIHCILLHCIYIIYKETHSVLTVNLYQIIIPMLLNDIYIYIYIYIYMCLYSKDLYTYIVNTTVVAIPAYSDVQRYMNFIVPLFLIIGRCVKMHISSHIKLLWCMHTWNKARHVCKNASTCRNVY